MFYNLPVMFMGYIYFKTSWTNLMLLTFFFLKEFGQCVIRICVTFTWQKIKLIPYSLIKYIYIFQTIASMWFLGDFVTGKVGCVLTVTNVFTIWNERIVPEVKNGEQ